jgi:hypothetical protein
VVLALSAFLLLDNVTRLHELVPAWPLLYAPLLLALAAAALVATNWSPLLVTGLALLLLSAAVHALGTAGDDVGWWPSGEERLDLWRFQILIAIKEGTELAGWLLFAPALALLASGGVADGGAPQPAAGLLGGSGRKDQLRARGEQLVRRWVLLTLAGERDPARSPEPAVGGEAP